jgi:hypothetical protein
VAACSSAPVESTKTSSAAITCTADDCNLCVLVGETECPPDMVKCCQNPQCPNGEEPDGFGGCRITPCCNTTCPNGTPRFCQPGTPGACWQCVPPYYDCSCPKTCMVTVVCMNGYSVTVPANSNNTSSCTNPTMADQGTCNSNCEGRDGVSSCTVAYQ